MTKYDYTDMNLDDLEQLVANKRKSQNLYSGTQKWDTPEQLQLKSANDAIRLKYGIDKDDLSLSAAEALLKQKKEAAKPINQINLPIKDTVVYKTPFTEPLLEGVQGRKEMLFGDSLNNILESPAVMALRKASEKAGENAYQSALGNLTEFTGGRLNSWAAKAAADSKQAYADKGDADVLNYVQMILSGQKAFTDDVFGYDTGFYGRDYQERQTPILNRQEDERIAIERLLAESGAEADRIRAQATAKNAATNASELAWRKEKEKEKENAAPNNDVVILYSDYVKAPDKNKWLNDMAPYLTQNELEWIIKQYKAQYGDIKNNSVLDELFK